MTECSEVGQRFAERPISRAMIPSLRQSSRQLHGNEFRLRFAHHSPHYRGQGEYRVMLRLKILASTLPLLLAAVYARGDFAATHPCISTGESSVQLATAPWQAQSTVAFTDDPAQATVRVQIVDSADTADFAVVDDVDSAEPGACAVTAATRFIAISLSSASTAPLIYLSSEANADYRIFVQSKNFTSRDAAALIVGANAGRGRMAQAAL